MRLIANADAPGKREQTKILNRKLILEAGRKVFAELGYGAATVRDIIRATPLASGTFYNYFKSKEEVYLALRDEAALAIRPRLHEERAKATTVEEFLLSSYRAFFEFAARDGVFFRTVRNAAGDTRLRMDPPEMIAGFEEIRGDIEAAIAKGMIPSVDTGFLVAAAVGVGFEVAEVMLQRDPPDPVAAAEFATALFLGGVMALPKKNAAP